MKKKSKQRELQDNIDMIFEKELGSAHPGAGRKKMKPNIKKKSKSFTLSVEAQNALRNLQEDLGLPSQTAVVEFLILKAHREMEQQPYIT